MKRITYSKVKQRVKGSFDSLKNCLKNTSCFFRSGRAYKNSLLAIYDFAGNPYDHSVAEFLASSEMARVKRSLFYMDVVLVADRDKKHRGDQPEVNEATFRNWIMNLAECADLLRSVSTLVIFDDRMKFLSFYQRVRHSHQIYPENGFVYRPRKASHLKTVSDYYRSTGYVPKFQSSQVLLEWAEKYFLERSYPLIPVVIFIRNSKTHPGRNTDLPTWFSFMRKVLNQYNVKFFLVNDFWNPVSIPEDLREKIEVSVEATMSTKYRVALTQRASLIMGQCIGSAVPIYLEDTPYLMFGFDNEYFSAQLNIELYGMTPDLQFPWASQYQKIFGTKGDAPFIQQQFDMMFHMLESRGKLVPNYFRSTDPSLMMAHSQV
ncbi:MAG: hypothetical protein HYS07_04975 [Chlamydiae bacterium]|nr:hypothetical protein [Chlamydiota bacterium]MBI3276244.1 hypothetical protein [Chlamydiota bacterium]